MSILTEIAKSYSRCFKRVLIKRRLLEPSGSNYYESDWYDVTADVISIEPVGGNVDNLELNSFTQLQFGLVCKNDNYKWANENFSQSYFSGFLTRHKTKVKIQAGYIDSDEVEYSYDVASGLIVGDEIVINNDGTAYIPVISAGTLFDEQSAEYVREGLLGDGSFDWWDNATVSTVVGYLYNLSFRGYAVFTPFLEGSIITPANDIIADIYNFSDWSCADALDKMAEVSNSAWWVNPSFYLQFKSKDATAVSQFTFSGPGVIGSDINIYSAGDYNEGLRNTYNRISWYNTDPPVEAKETWQAGDTTSTWKYGERTYSVDNRLVTTSATRQTICNNLLSAYKTPKEEITIRTKFVPQLNLLDRVTLNYYGDPSVSARALWGLGLWGKAVWTGRRGGIKISKDMKIMKLTHNVMQFYSDLALREI